MKRDQTTYGLEEIKAISYFSRSLHEKESVEAVLWGVTRNIVQQLGFVDCVIYILDSKREVMVQEAAYGSKNPVDTVISDKIVIPLGEGIVGSVALSGKAEVIADTSGDERYIVDDKKRLSEICVPITLGGKLFGVIDSEHPQRDFYTEKHLHLLTIIASLCAQRIKELHQNSKKSFDSGNRHFRRLEKLVKEDVIYRDCQLSLGSTADMLGISACYLSSLVNGVTASSFIDYINGYRVADVKKCLIAEEYDHYTMVSIGLEAGFNSRSAFYTAFKRHTGMTPSEFRDEACLRMVALY